MSKRVTAVLIRLDSGARVVVSMRGIVEVKKEEMEQAENVRMKYQDRVVSFSSVGAMFNALAAYEGAARTREIPGKG